MILEASRNPYRSQKEPRQKRAIAARDLALEICSFLNEKKAEDVLLLDLYKINSYFDYFLLASASSQPHLSFLQERLRKDFSEHIAKKKLSAHSQDKRSGWLIIDMVDIVAHLFLHEQRTYYNLERLWGDAERLYP